MTNVLVVDDMADFRKLMTLILSTKGRYGVLEARDGFEALQQAQQHIPDLIILDYMMPDMDGLEVCRQLRADPRTASIPVLMVTARTDTVVRGDALAAGVTSFMAKPVRPRDLLAETARLLSVSAPAG